MSVLGALPLLAALAWLGVSGVPRQAPAGTSAEVLFGAELYATQCASCHGDDAAGVATRGPAIADEGTAAVDFVLRTGRMPMADPEMQARRGPVQFNDDQIVSLVDYVGSLGQGPAIPVVDASAGSVQRGGDLYRLNCAACHVASGAGASIGGGRQAPSVMTATPTQIGEAIAIGPGAMPVFGSFGPNDTDDVAAYIAWLQRADTASVSSFGGAGPVAEGLAAWLLGLLPLIGLARWIGTRHSGRDTGAHPPEAVP
jgi:ubiquinol-cytochrome c reductase cytochrome c subunit